MAWVSSHGFRILSMTCTRVHALVYLEWFSCLGRHGLRNKRVSGRHGYFMAWVSRHGFLVVKNITHARALHTYITYARAGILELRFFSMCIIMQKWLSQRNPPTPFSSVILRWPQVMLMTCWLARMTVSTACRFGQQEGRCLLRYFNREGPQDWRADGHRWINQGTTSLSRRDPLVKKNYFYIQTESGGASKSFIRSVFFLPNDKDNGPFLIQYLGDSTASKNFGAQKY